MEKLDDKITCYSKDFLDLMSPLSSLVLSMEPGAQCTQYLMKVFFCEIEYHWGVGVM